MTPLSRQPSTTAMPLRCVRGVCDYYGTFYSAHNQQSTYTFTDCRMDVFVYDDARLCAQRRKTPSSSSYTIMEQYVIWLHQFNLIHRVFYVLWVSAWADRRKRIYKKKNKQHIEVPICPDVDLNWMRILDMTLKGWCLYLRIRCRCRHILMHSHLYILWNPVAKQQAIPLNNV